MWVAKGQLFLLGCFPHIRRFDLLIHFTKWTWSQNHTINNSNKKCKMYSNKSNNKYITLFRENILTLFKDMKEIRIN